MNRRIASTISRLGHEVDILTRSQTGTDEFNNPVSSWSVTGTSECVRTYPNRNTQIEGSGGSYDRDRPLFIFEHSKAPPSDSRIRYLNTLYELQSPTEYDSHIAIFGEKVSE